MAGRSSPWIDTAAVPRPMTALVAAAERFGSAGGCGVFHARAERVTVDASARPTSTVRAVARWLCTWMSTTTPRTPGGQAVTVWTVSPSTVVRRSTRSGRQTTVTDSPYERTNRLSRNICPVTVSPWEYGGKLTLRTATTAWST